MKGYLPHSTVKAVVFWILVLCVVAITVAGICFAWDTIGRELARRWMWSAFILASGSMAFLGLNFMFGHLEYDVFGSNRQSPSMDPAFADRLKKAKDFREEHSNGESQKTG